MSDQHKIDLIKKHQTEIVDNQASDDAAALQAIGKQQVYVRKFNFWTALGLAVCVSGSWEGITAAMAQALMSGGPVAVVYGFLAASTGACFVTMSLAEIASALPTSGAIYYWIMTLSPERYRGFTGFVVGYILLGTGWLGITSAGIGVAVQTQAYAMVTHPEYVAEKWHTVLIFALISIIAIALNITGGRTLKYLSLIGMFLHVLGYFAILITLLVCTPEKHDARYIFTSFENYSGWNDGMAWCIGLLSSVYGFVALETVAYFSEEVHHAAMTVPRVMVANTVCNAIFTFPLVVVILMCMGDLNAVLESPIGFMTPTTQIYINSTGSVAAGVVLNSTSTFIAFTAMADAIGSGSRAVVAMARDGMFHQVFAYIEPRFDSPIWAILLVSLPSVMLSLIYLGNSTAFYGFMSGIMTSTTMLYCATILLILLAKFKGAGLEGPWNLGKWGIPINIASVAWVAFLSVCLSFPTSIPVTAQNMNYAAVMVAAVLTISLGAWVIYGRRSGYQGPVVEVVEGTIDGQEVPPSISRLGINGSISGSVTKTVSNEPVTSSV